MLRLRVICTNKGRTESIYSNLLGSTPLYVLSERVVELDLAKQLIRTKKSQKKGPIHEAVGEKRVPKGEFNKKKVSGLFFDETNKPDTFSLNTTTQVCGGLVAVDSSFPGGNLHPFLCVSSELSALTGN